MYSLESPYTNSSINTLDLHLTSAYSKEDGDARPIPVTICVSVLGLLPDLAVGKGKDSLAIPPFKFPFNLALDCWRAR